MGRLTKVLHQTIDRCQKDQQIRRQQRSHQCAQAVIVAELQFLHRDRVVFIDDGYDLILDERLQCAAHIQIAVVIFQIVMSQQHLRDIDPVNGKQLLINGHQTALSHSGASLQIGQLGWLLFKSQYMTARGHRAG